MLNWLYSFKFSFEGFISIGFMTEIKSYICCLSGKYSLSTPPVDISYTRRVWYGKLKEPTRSGSS